MKTLGLAIKIYLWVMLTLMVLGFQTSRAAQGELEYRFERMQPPQEQPWTFNVPSGIAIAQDGTLWVADTGNHNLQHFHADGTFISQFGSDGSNTGQFGNGFQISLASDGSIWVADSSNNRLQHFNSDGTFIGQFGNQGSGEGQFDNPNGIAVAPDQSVWVADTLNKRLQHFSPEGTFIGQFGSKETDTEHFFLPNAIAVAADGSLWVSHSYENWIKHFTTKGEFIAQIIIPYTSSIAVATDGSVWVTDLDHNLILHFGPDGKLISQFENAGLGRSLSITLAKDGSIWEANADNKLLLHFSADGRLLAQLGKGISGVGQFYGPSDLEVAADNSIWVADTNNDRLQHLNSDGTFIEQLGSQGNGDGQFAHPDDLALAVDGSLWIADSGNFRVQHISIKGDFLGEFRVLNNGFPGAPIDLALAKDGSIWIGAISQPPYFTYSFFEYSFIHHVNKNGSSIAQFYFADWPTTLPGSIPNIISYYPNGITLATDDSVWLADTGVQSIRHYTPDGALIGQFGSPGNAPGQLNYPNDIALTTDASLWVADTGNGRIQHFNTDGSYIASFGSKGKDTGQFQVPSGIALAADKALWVADSGNNCIQKFVPRAKGATAHPYKAIILSGGGEKTGNTVNALWSGIWQVAQKANRAFKFQGFKAHEEILFLTAGDTRFDLDSNGEADDLQAATKDSLRIAITEWAKDSNDVVVYLTGQSATNKFQINGTETLTGEELSAWLTELEKTIPGKVTVIIEADNAGSFLNALAVKNRPRTLIAGTQANKPAILANHGVNSFSYSFWSKVMDGATLKDSFTAARQAMSALLTTENQTQNALLDTNGDALSNEQDLISLGDYCLGNCNKTITNPPVINSLSQADVTLKDTTSLEFKITVRHSEQLLDVWALVQRPDAFNNGPDKTLNIEKIPLSCDAQQQCTGRYYRFDAQGQYRINFYALDTQYKLSAPATLLVNQTQTQAVIPVEYDDQKALLYLYDVEVAGQHYQATLQLQNGLFHLQSFSLTPDRFSPVANFDASTNLLTIPLARVYGQHYQGSFKLADNYLFELLTATPK